MTTEQLKHELKVWHSRAQAHEENYEQMLRRVDAIAAEYRLFVVAVQLNYRRGTFNEYTPEEFERWLRDNAPFATGSMGEPCRECGTFEEPCFSRIEPMGYFCPNCGTEAQ